MHLYQVRKCNRAKQALDNFRRYLDTAGTILATAENIKQLEGIKDLLDMKEDLVDASVDLGVPGLNKLRQWAVTMDKLLVANAPGVERSQIHDRMGKVIVKSLVLSSEISGHSRGTIPPHILVSGDVEIDTYDPIFGEGFIVTGDFRAKGICRPTFKKGTEIYGDVYTIKQNLKYFEKLKAEGNLLGDIHIVKK